MFVVCLIGYCFLLFQDELSVQALTDASIVEDGKMYWCVTSPTMKDKLVRNAVMCNVYCFIRLSTTNWNA